MFAIITQLHYQGKSGREHIWLSNALDCSLAGTALGSEIVRIRALRGKWGNEPHYQLSDGGTSTLPYHSWIVAKDDEQWPDLVNDADEQSRLEPYLHGFACSPSALRLTRLLASQERIYGLGERTGGMNKRGQAFPIWNV